MGIVYKLPKKEGECRRWMRRVPLRKSKQERDGGFAQMKDLPGFPFPAPSVHFHAEKIDGIAKQ